MPDLRLAVALSDAGAHPGAWHAPAARPHERFTARYWLELVREAECGLLHLVTLEDDVRPQAAGPGAVRGRLDAVMVALAAAPSTRAIGLLPAATTGLTEPFLLSSQIATLDFVSRGRAGWLCDVSLRADDGGYVGPRPVPPPGERYAEAADHVTVVRRLWESWEPDAEIRDTERHRFLDRDRIHAVGFEGAHFSVRGPSITPRPPQGQPVVATVANDAAARAFAAAAADVVFSGHDERPATDGLALLDVLVVLDDDRGAALARRDRLDALAPARFTGREFTGTPGELSERILDWSALGYDGYRLHPATLPYDLQAITRRLVPELQARRVLRRAYLPGTLRDRLGLPRPAGTRTAA